MKGGGRGEVGQARQVHFQPRENVMESSDFIFFNDNFGMERSTDIRFRGEEKDNERG